MLKLAVEPDLRIVPLRPFELRSWGEFALIDRFGRNVSPRGRKARAIIAYLAGHSAQPVRRERLATLLWGDRGDEQARASLRQSLYELRALCEGSVPLLEISRDHVTLNPAAIEDSEGAAARLAAAGNTAALADFLSAAGPLPFEDLDGLGAEFDEWLRDERTRRGGDLTRIGLASVQQALDGDDAAGALRLLAALDRLDPLDEEIARLGMRAEASSGDRAGCERRFNRLRDRLKRELDVEPSHETEALHAELTHRFQTEGQAPFDLPVPQSAFAAAASSRRRSGLAAALVAVIGLALAWVWNVRTSATPAVQTIAVMPFRAIGGEAHLAEGVSEEILGALAVSPHLKVIGRTSSSAFNERQVDARQLGRKLGVAYLIEGSVRSAGRRVRIDVALVRTADGVRSWSERYDSGVDDIFRLQENIGIAVARHVAGTSLGVAGARPTTRFDTYNLYLAARALLRERSPARAEAAAELLRRAVALDPAYAPAWSSLGIAVAIQAEPRSDGKPDPAKWQEALSYSRRALALAPKSGTANAAYGAIIFQSDIGESLKYLERAAAAEPGNAETWHWLSIVYDRVGDYPRSLEAARRAVSIDPLWKRAFGYAAEAAWERGHRQEATAYLKRTTGTGLDPAFTRHATRSHMAYLQGDFSGAAGEADVARRLGSASNKPIAEWMLASALWRLGHLEKALAVRPDLHSADLLHLWQGKLPADPLRNPLAWDRRLGRVNPKRYLALRMLINAGRPREVVEYYDRTFGSPGALARHPEGHLEFIYDASAVSGALREVGRQKEAGAILAAANVAIAKRLERGAVAPWYHAAAAQIWALQGKNDQAAAALDTTMKMGWSYSCAMGALSVGDIGLEPAFRGLHGDDRFKRIRSYLNREVERERRELDPKLISA